MRYTNFTNLDSRYSRPYEPGDRLVQGYEGEVDVPGGEPVKVTLERLFARHNWDDRPDGQLCPSMSIGDVVILDGAAYSVGAVGFKPVDIAPADLITDRTWLQMCRGER